MAKGRAVFSMALKLVLLYPPVSASYPNPGRSCAGEHRLLNTRDVEHDLGSLHRVGGRVVVQRCEIVRARDERTASREPANADVREVVGGGHGLAAQSEREGKGKSRSGTFHQTTIRGERRFRGSMGPKMVKCVNLATFDPLGCRSYSQTIE